MAKKKIDDPIAYLNNFFTSDENMKNLFNALVRELIESMEEQSNKAPVTYGINFTVKNGEASVNQIGAPRPSGGTELQEEREPLVDVIGDEKRITVIAEVPGVDKSEIKLRYEPSILEIYAKGRDINRNYFKRVNLPYHMATGTIRANYTNGVLEVTMKKGNKKVNADSITIE